MTRRRAAIAAVVVAGAMALMGVGISHTGQTKAKAELDVSGDKAVLVAALVRSDQEQAGSEMSTPWW
jgi:hypothetical protein